MSFVVDAADLRELDALGGREVLGEALTEQIERLGLREALRRLEATA